MRERLIKSCFIYSFVSAGVAPSLIYHCCIVVFPPLSFTAQPKIPHNNSSLFFFTQIPLRCCQWDARDGLSHWSWRNRMSGVLQDKKALCKILLRLDRWFAPVLITTVKHRSKLHHPSLEAEYAWRLTQIPYCEIITQQKILCFWSFGRI